MFKSLTAILLLVTFTHAAEAKCKVTKIETDINAIRLGDEASVERALGKLAALPIGANEKDPSATDSPTLVLFNKDRTEQARLTKHPGDTPGSFLEVRVQSAEGAKLVGKTVEAAHLATERGVHLGVTEKFVTQLLGDCYTRSVSKTGETTLEYVLEDMSHPYLKRVNMPAYYARYIFRDGKLIAFEFGSEYA